MPLDKELLKSLEPLENQLFSRDGDPPKKSDKEILKNLERRSIGTTTDPFGISGLDGLFKSGNERVGDRLMLDESPFEIAARSQSGWDQLANGLIKATTNVGSTFLGGTLGLAAGVSQLGSNLVDEGTLAGAVDGLVNNGFNDTLDGFTESMQQMFPNLRSRKEQEMGAFESMGTMNFWADDFANGISFTVGALLTEAAYSALTVGSLGTLSGIQAAGTTALMMRAAKGFGNFVKMNKIAMPINQTAKLARQVFTGAGYEAAFEARHGYNEMVNVALSQMREENPGVILTEADLDPEKLKKIRAASNALFGGNLALVSASNFIVFGKTFKAPKIADIRRRLKARKITENAEGVLTTVKKSAFEKAGLTTMFLTKGALSEGFMEEGGQSLMNRMAVNHINRLKDPLYAKQTYDMVQGFTDALEEAKGDKGFHKEILIGSLIGSLGNTISSPKSIIKDNVFTNLRKIWADENPEIQEMLNAINNSKSDSFLKASVRTMNMVNALEKEYVAALDADDVAAAKNAESELMFAYMYGRYSMGLDKMLYEEIQRVAELSVDEFREAYMDDPNVAEDVVRERQAQVVESTKSKMNMFSKAIDTAQAMFMGQSDDTIRGAAYLFYEQKSVEERKASLKQDILKNFSFMTEDDLTSMSKAFLQRELEKTPLWKEAQSINKKLLRVKRDIRKLQERGKQPVKLAQRQEELQQVQDILEKELETAKNQMSEELEKQGVSAAIKEISEEDFTTKESIKEMLEGALKQKEMKDRLLSNADIDLEKKQDFDMMVGDLVYLSRKSATMDRFINGFFDKKARTKFSEHIDRESEKSDKFIRDAIEDLQYDNVISVAGRITEAQTAKESGNVTPIEFNKSFIAKIGQLLSGDTRTPEQKQKDLEEQEEKDLEEIVAQKEDKDKKANTDLTTDEKELAGEEEESEDPVRTSFVDRTTFLRVSMKMDNLFELDENGDPVVLKVEFRKETPGYQENRNKSPEFRFYRALYSLHKLKTGKGDHYLTTASGETITTQDNLVFNTHIDSSKGVEEEFFKTGESPIVVRLEDKEGNPVKINGEDVISWLPLATYTTKTGETRYSRFEFKKFFAEQGQEYNKELFKDLETLDQRVREADENDRDLGQLKKELLAYEKQRDSILEGKPMSFPISGISFNPGKLVGRRNSNRSSVIDLFGSWEKFQKAIDDGRVSVQSINRYVEDKDRKIPIFSNSDKVIGGKLIGAPGQAHLIIDGISYRLDKGFLSDSEEAQNDIRNIIEATQGSLREYRTAMEEIRKMKRDLKSKSVSEERKNEIREELDKREGKVVDSMELPFITTKSNLQKENKVDIGSAIRNIAGVAMLIPRDFKAVNGALVLDPQKVANIEKRNWVYLSTSYVNKKGEIKPFTSYTSGYVFHYKDPATGKYTTKSFDDIVKQPYNKKGVKTEGEKVLFNRDLLKQILENARHRTPIISDSKGVESPITKITRWDPEKKVFSQKTVTFAEHFFKTEQKLKIIGEPVIPEEKPTIDDMITGMQVLSPSIQLLSMGTSDPIERAEEGVEEDPDQKSGIFAVARAKSKKENTQKEGPQEGEDLSNYEDLGELTDEGFIQATRPGNSTETPKQAKARNSADNSAIPGAVSTQEADYGTSIDAELEEKLKAFRKTIEPEYKKGDYQKVKSLAYRQIYQNKKGVTAPDMSDAENLQLLSNYPGLFEETKKALEAKQKTLDAFDKEKVKAGKENLVPVYVLDSSLNKNTGKLDLTWVQISLEDVRDKTGLELSDYTFEQLINYDQTLKETYAEQSNAAEYSINDDVAEDEEDPNDPLGGITLRVRRKEEKVLTSKEKAWFKNTFPNIETEYGTLEAGVAAMIKNGRVIVSKDASGKTLYHEGFHVYLRATHKDQADLDRTLLKVKKELGDKIIETQEGKKIVLIKASDATLKQIEEYLAEEFGVYMEMEEDYNFPSKSIKSFFEKIWEAIKSLLGISSESKMSYLFRDLSGINTYKIDRNSLEKAIPGQVYRLDPEIGQYINVVHQLFFKQIKKKEKVQGEMYTNLEELISTGDFFQEFSDYISSLEEVARKKGWDPLIDNKEELLVYYRQVLSNMDVQEFDEFLEQLDLRQAGKDNVDFAERDNTSALERASKPLKLFLLDKSNLYSSHRLGVVLHNSLESSSTPEEMMKRLEEMTSQERQRKEAIDRIDSKLSKEVSPKEKKTLQASKKRLQAVQTKYGEIGPMILDIYETLSDVKTKEMSTVYRDFYTNFSQSKTDASYVLVGPTNSIVNSTLKQTSESIKREWLSNANMMLISRPEEVFLKKEDGVLVLDPVWEKAGPSNWTTKKAVIDSFQALGFLLTEEEYAKDPIAFQEFLTGVSTTAKQLRAEKKSTRLDSLFNDDGTHSKQLGGRTKAIMEVFKQTRPINVELAGFSQGGKKKYAISLSTLAHRLPSFVRQGSEIFNNPSRSKSLLYKKMKEHDMRVFEITGMDSTGGSSAGFHNLSAADQAYVSIEAVMNGLMLLPADGRNTLRAIDVKGTGYDTMSETIFIQRMMDNLRIEMEEFKRVTSSKRHFKRRSKSFEEGLMVFRELDLAVGRGSRGISPLLKTMSVEQVIQKVGQEKLVAHMKTQFTAAKESLEAYMVENGLVEKKQNKETVTTTVRLNLESFVDNYFGTETKASKSEDAYQRNKNKKGNKNNFVFDSKAVKEINDKDSPSEQLYDNFLAYVAGNQLLFSLDASVVYGGGLYSYKDIDDMFKRHSRITSPQMNNAIGKKSLEDLDTYYPRSPLKMGKDSLGKSRRSTLKTVTVQELFSESYVKNRPDMKVADAFSWMGYDAYRDMRIEIGRWSDNDEALYQYDMQSLFRIGMERREDPFYNKENFNIMFQGHAVYGESSVPRFKNQDIDVNKLTATTEIEKPHGIGPATYNDGSVSENHMMKTAVMPIRYLEHTKNPSMLNLALDMLSNGVDLIQTESSNKGDYSVDAGLEAPALFRKNENGTYYYKSGALSKKDIQDHVASFPVELFSIQQDPSKDSDYTTLSVQLNSLVKSGILQRLEGPEKERMMKLATKAEYIIQTIRDKAYRSILKELGVDQYDNIPKENWGKLKKILLDGASNKNTSDSVRYAIESLLDKESALFSENESLNLDYSSMGEKLSTMLTSAIESRVIKLRSPGAQLVQIPNAFYSRVLNFYKQGVKETYKAEIMISFPKKLVPWMLENYGSLENFNNKLREGKIDKDVEKILTEIVGNRVPTSGMNLIESFKVVEFLHWTSGKKVVLPDGMTEKAGSDFDIDKLTAYFDSLDVLEEKGKSSIVSFSPKNISADMSLKELDLYYSLVRQRIGKIKNSLKNKKRDVKKKDVEDLFNEPLIQFLALKSKSKEVRDSLDLFTNIQEDQKNLILTKEKELLKILESIELPEAKEIHKNLSRYEDVLPNRYLMNSLKDIYNEFITHPENYNDLTTPLSMDIFEEAVKSIKEEIQKKDSKRSVIERAFDFAEHMKRKWRFVSGTSDLGITAKALSVQGLLSSSDKRITTRLRSIFNDIEGNFVLGKNIMSNNMSVIGVLNQLAQAQLEIEKNPTLAYLNIMGEVNLIFQTMVRVFPGDSSLSVETILSFLTSEEVMKMTKEASVRSSEIARMKKGKRRKNNPEGYVSFPAFLSDIAGKSALSEGFNTQPDYEVMNEEIFDEKVMMLDISSKDLGNAEWRKNNPDKIASVLLFYYNLSNQLQEVDKRIYQDASFASGFSNLNAEVLDMQDFAKEPGKGSNLIWNHNDVEDLNNSNRTGVVENVVRNFSKILLKTKIRGASDLVHDRLNDIVRSLPRSRKRESAVKKVELYFMTYIIHNHLPDMQGYQQVLSDKVTDKIESLKKKYPSHPIWSKLEPVAQRINNKDKTRSPVNTVLLNTTIRDVNELNLLHSRLLNESGILKDLALLSMMKSGFVYEYQGLDSLLPEDYLMELYIPAYKSFVDKMSTSSEAEIITYLNTMEDIITSNYKVATDSSIVSKLRDPLYKSDLIPEVLSHELYALKSKSIHLLGELFSPKKKDGEEDTSPEDNEDPMIKLRRASYSELQQMLSDNELTFIINEGGFAKYQDAESGQVFNVYFPFNLRGDRDLLAFQDEIKYMSVFLNNARKEAQRNLERAQREANPNIGKTERVYTTPELLVKEPEIDEEYEEIEISKKGFRMKAFIKKGFEIKSMRLYDHGDGKLVPNQCKTP